MAPKIVDKKSKQMDILNAALRIFAQKGTAKTKISDIAEEAGIGKGTIYEYFKNKEHLINSLHEYMFGQYDEMIAVRIYKITDPEKKIRALVNALYEMIEFVSFGTMKLYLEFWAESVRIHKEGSMHAVHSKYVEEYRKMISEIIEDGIRKGIFRKVNSVIAASALFAGLDGLMFQLILDEKAFSMKEACDLYADIFIKGLKK